MRFNLFSITLLFGTVCFAQEKFLFDYDLSGNMTCRQIDFPQRAITGDYVFELIRTSSSGDFTLLIKDQYGHTWYGDGNVKVVNVLTFSVCYDEDFIIDSSNSVATLDLKFLDNRLGIDYTFSKQNIKDQIFDVPLAGSTGYSSITMNAGSAHTNSHEVVIYTTPFRNEDWEWNVNFNYTKMENVVDESILPIENPPPGHDDRGDG